MGLIGDKLRKSDRKRCRISFTMIIRLARKNDILAVIEMIAYAPLGKFREDFQNPLPKKYDDAFENIIADSNQALVVMGDLVR